VRGERQVGDVEDRLESLTALLFGPTRRTPVAEAQERRAEIGRLYVSWMMGEIEEPPKFDDPEDARLWEKMTEYEEAAARVAERVESKP
jgi:hypothetical protein